MTQRAGLVLEIAIAAIVAIAVWLALYYWLPPIAAMDDPTARLAFSLKCAAVAILFCFVLGVEAVAHERFRSPAIDPLAGYTTKRLTINLRYLQHTLEQLVIFLPGLFGLAYYSADGSAMRAVVATTVVWMLGRFAFWIGYHRGSMHRAAGAPGMALAMLVLLYVAARFGYEIAAWPGAIAILILFAVGEAVLVAATKPIKPP